MNPKLMNAFRRELQRGLRRVGFYQDEAMDIVERAQRLAPSHIRYFPETFFDIERSLEKIAQNENTSRDDAWYRLQEDPELLFKAAGLKSWSQLKQERITEEQLDRNEGAPLPANDAPRLTLKNPNAKLIVVPGYMPPAPVAQPKMRSDVDGRVSTKIVPSDTELARIAKDIYEKTKQWPKISDGTNGLPNNVRPWYFLFKTLSERGTSLPQIVNAAYPKIKLTAKKRFKTGVTKKEKTPKLILSDDELALAAIAFHRKHGHLPTGASSHDSLPTASYSWAYILQRCNKERGRTLKNIVADYIDENNLPALRRVKKVGKKPSPLPDEKTLVNLIDVFVQKESRYPLPKDGKLHLPAGTLGWSMLRSRIKEEYGLTLKELHRNNQIDGFKKSNTVHTPRLRYIRERLENSLAELNVPTGRAQHFIEKTLILVGDAAVPEGFYNLKAGAEKIAGLHTVSQQNALNVILDKPELLLGINGINLRSANKIDKNAHEDIISSTLKKTIKRAPANLAPELRERLINTYHAFSDAAEPSKDSHMSDPFNNNQLQSLLSFVFEDAGANKVETRKPYRPQKTNGTRKKRQRANKVDIDDKMLWSAIDKIKMSTGHYPTTSDSHRSLPENTYGWVTIITRLRVRGFTPRSFHAKFKPETDIGHLDAQFNAKTFSNVEVDIAQKPDCVQPQDPLPNRVSSPSTKDFN
jgi:hypothetical protein